MKKLIEEAKENLKKEGVEATHLLINSATKIDSELDKPGEKHIVDMATGDCKFMGNLFGMDVYVDPRLKKGCAYLLDMNEPEENKFIKAYESLIVRPPKGMVKIGSIV